MEFYIKIGKPEKQRGGCLVLGIFKNRQLSAEAKHVNVASNGYLVSVLKYGDMQGEIGQTLLLHDVPGVLADRVLLVGCGKERDLNASNYRKIISNSVRALSKTGMRKGSYYLSSLAIKGCSRDWQIMQAILLMEDALYEFLEFKSKQQKRKHPLQKLTFFVSDQDDKSSLLRTVEQAKGIADGVRLAKDLANRPANICTPDHLAKQAMKLGKTHSNCKVTVLNEGQMKKLGMGALLAVAQGSKEAAKLITLEYKGAPKKAAQPVVLVGKGVTFDTGGISIKPSSAMDEMKFDMCGGAAVLGVLSAVASLSLPINVVGVIPATENMPSGQAVKPGDIVTSLSGQTIEVLNTDAEGRLILCDALSYSKKFNPLVVIDMATLTGACVIALGKHPSGLMANDAALVKDLLAAGNISGDRAWELPLWEDYQQDLDSPFADMANIGGRAAGSITAGCFLARFTKEYRWAHLDIAGTAWYSGKKKGATGRPVPLLMHYLLDRCVKTT